MPAMDNFIGHTQLQEEYEMCVRKGLVPYVRSSPGIGKTDSVKQFAKKNKLEVIDLSLSQCSPEDLQGYPMREGNKATFTPFDMFPLEGEPLPKDEKGKELDGWVLLLDELSSANKPVQAAAYKLILGRMVGSYNLHPRCAVIACGNLITDKAVVYQMSTAMKSRLIHYQLETTVPEWTEWAINNNIDHRIPAFINFDNKQLMNFNPDAEDNTFACPRTWEFLNRYTKDEEIDREQHTARILGTVGSAAGLEFLSFCEVYKELPKWEYLVDPRISETLKPPTEPAAKFAIVSWIGSEAQLEEVDTLIPYIKKFGGDFQLLFCRQILRRFPNLDRQSKVFSQFSMSIISKALR